MIRRDAFDSDVLGKRCGVVEAIHADVSVEHLHPWDHVRVIVPLNSSPVASFAEARRFENLGFHLASIRGTFEGTLIAYGDHYDTARIPTDSEAETVCEVASALFTHSRFNTDPFYSYADSKKIHERWVARLLNDRCLYVRGPFGEPRGFVGFSRTSHGHEPLLDIELIGSLDHKHGSGRHTLASLVVAERCHFLRAKTQISNLAAIGLYESCGMKLTRTEAILTWSRP